MLVAASLIAAIFPMTAYLLIIWRMDKYEPEPLRFVISHFIWGAFGAIIFAVAGSSAVAWILGLSYGVNYHPLIMTVVTAPVLEEITKGIYLKKTYNDRRMDNVTDGLVYGAAIGLGFGMTENFFYFITYGDTFPEWFGLVIIRSGFSAMMHCVSTGVFGAILGYIKFSHLRYKRILVLAAILISILIHSFWNISVSFNSTYQFGFLFLIILVLLFLVLFKLSLFAERRILNSELINELPDDIRLIVASDKRFKKGWIQEEIRANLIKTSTQLAFRKRQLSMQKQNEKLSDEITILREKMIHLLGTTEETGTE